MVAAEAAVGFVEDYVLVDFCADLVRLSIFLESGGDEVLEWRINEERGIVEASAES